MVNIQLLHDSPTVSYGGFLKWGYPWIKWVPSWMRNLNFGTWFRGFHSPSSLGLCSMAGHSGPVEDSYGWMRFWHGVRNLSHLSGKQPLNFTLSSYKIFRIQECLHAGRFHQSVESSIWIGFSIINWLGFNPSEKYESQLGLLSPIYGKIKAMLQTTNQITIIFPLMFVYSLLSTINHHY